MMRVKLSALIVLAMPLAGASALPPKSAFAPKVCSAPLDQDPSIRCGTLVVPENRMASGGRTIALNVVILDALTDRPTLPPLFDIDGGPGLASTRSAVFYATDGRPYRQKRAVVLVDQRGTGGSGALNCPQLGAAADPFAPLYPPDAVARCREQLARKADLQHYGTDEAARDLDSVRETLGYPQIDIVALSYGTTLALRYLALFPGRTRAAVLSGTVPSAARPPRDHASNAATALGQLFTDCAADQACAKAFPDPAGDAAGAARKLGPARAEVFFEAIRTALYAPTTARQVPWILHAAAAGNFAPFRALKGGGTGLDYADGLYLSITCGESLAGMNLPTARRAARNTVFGDYRLRRQQAACAQWPEPAAPSAFYHPVKSDAVVLLLNGGRDPVTPRNWSEQVARTLRNSKIASIPWSGHVFDGLSGVDSCYDPLLISFFDAGSAAGLDFSCLTQMMPPPFKTADAP